MKILVLILLLSFKLKKKDLRIFCKKFKPKRSMKSSCDYLNFITFDTIALATCQGHKSVSQIGSILMISDLYDPETFLYTFTLGPCLICFFKFLCLTQLNKLLHIMPYYFFLHVFFIEIVMKVKPY